jgi:uncharacterized protein YdeI (YjbR/CyaY-like superfamily)
MPGRRIGTRHDPVPDQEIERRAGNDHHTACRIDNWTALAMMLKATRRGEDRVTLDLGARQKWRSWLKKNHAAYAEVWLVFHKRRGKASMTYEDAVQEALCFGWIDSIVRRLDDDRYARKFTPRRPESRWSTINRRRYESLKARGLLAAAGRRRAPTDRSGDAPHPSVSVLPAYIARELKANMRACKYFHQLAPSYRRLYIAWIDSAKRDETKARRLREAIGMLAAGKKLGLK